MFCLHICLCEIVGAPETRVTGSYELPCGGWELNPAPLEEQPLLLTSESSLQPEKDCLFFKIALLSCLKVVDDFLTV